VSKPQFVVALPDLERGPKEVSWRLDRGWVRHVLEGTDAVPADEDGTLHVELSKTGREVMVRGELEVALSMPCSRTLEPVPVSLKSGIFLLLAPAAGHEAARGSRARHSDRSGTKPRMAHKTSKARGAGWADDPVLRDDDAARDTYSGEEIVLDPFVREFILLELPMVPLQNGLPSAEMATTAGSSREAPGERPVDPRLLPLVEIANRMRNKE